MKFNEKKGDLFQLDNNKYFFAHCISSDYALGAGIAVDFQKRYNLKESLIKTGTGSYPELITINNVFNLVTKKRCWNKPTYESITKCIQYMRDMCVNCNIRYLAMPKIGCGLDRLQWSKVREIIINEFQDLDIEIEVRYL